MHGNKDHYVCKIEIPIFGRSSSFICTLTYVVNKQHLDIHRIPYISCRLIVVGKQIGMWIVKVLL